MHNLLVLLWLMLATGTSWAADAKKTAAPGRDDLSRYTAAAASPGGQTILRDASGRTVKAHRDQVTVIGSLPLVSAGEWVTAEGRWVQDREFGLQFKAEMLNSTAPTTKEGIEKYLGSGMVKGIGPIYAKKLVSTFGEQIFDVIETQLAKLEGCSITFRIFQRPSRVAISWSSLFLLPFPFLKSCASS